MNNVIVYGSPGCGKTTNGEALRAFYGKSKVVEGDEFFNSGRRASPRLKAVNNALILTTATSLDLFPMWTHTPRMISYYSAMKEAGL